MKAAAKPGTKRPQSRRVSPARLYAFNVLRRVEDEGAYASILLASGADTLGQEDRALSYELVMGVLRWQLWLDTWIRHLSGRSIESLDPDVRRALRLGLYQLKFLSRVPASAAVNESVNLAYVSRRHSAGAFINAVLRRATREHEFSPGATIEDPIARAAVETSHPEGLLRRWVAELGFDEAVKFAAANNEPAPTAFRLGSLSADEETLLERLSGAGGTITRSKISTAGWRLKGAMQASRDLAADGWIYFQDESSQLVAELVDPRPGEIILDACAAPGSKSTLLSRLVGDQAKIFATDLHRNRIELISNAAAKQGFKGIVSIVADASCPPFRDALFDRILVDAPCSGTGTLRRNPEIRWRITPSDIEELAGLQLNILKAAASNLKPGGTLVYSTCSIEQVENEKVVNSFLRERTDFSIEQPRTSQQFITEQGFVRIWPHLDGADGFFAAVLRRDTSG